jgi:CBS domain containing-hemolysin-like protein
MTSSLLAASMVIALGAVLSFLFSGMEAGVFALNRLRIRQLVRAGHRRARLLQTFLDNPEDFLWTILVGNTSVNILVVSLVVSGLHHLPAIVSRPWLFVGVLAAIVFVFYALCDLLPKMLFQQFPNRLCLAVAGPFRLAHLGLAPLVALTSWFADRLLRWTGGTRFTGRLFASREELRQLMHDAARALSSEERAMIDRVLELQDLTLRQITIPLAQVVCVAQTATAAEIIDLCREHRISRVPVLEAGGSRRRIIGVVSLRTLLSDPETDPPRTAAQLLAPAQYLQETLRLEEALRQIQRSGHRLAIVLDAEGREVGIATLKDILSRIFGNVRL